MKRAILGVLVFGLVSAGAVAVWRAHAGESTPPALGSQPAGDQASPAELKKQIEDLKADLAKLTDQQKATADELAKLKIDFKRHSHPVLMLDAKGGAAPWPWKPGAFFVAYPKIGRGDTDADAMAAGGTWGKP